MEPVDGAPQRHAAGKCRWTVALRRLSGVDETQTGSLLSRRSRRKTVLFDPCLPPIRHSPASSNRSLPVPLKNVDCGAGQTLPRRTSKRSYCLTTQNAVYTSEILSGMLYQMLMAVSPPGRDKIGLKCTAFCRRFSRSIHRTPKPITHSHVFQRSGSHENPIHRGSSRSATDGHRE